MALHLGSYRLIATGAVLLGTAALFLYSPRLYTGSSFGLEAFGELYREPDLPPTATDISFYHREAWGNKHLVITFTVPDEATFVDWATPIWGPPRAEGTVHVETWEGGQWRVVEPQAHLTVTDCRRGETRCTVVVFDRQGRRVYYNHRSGSTNREG